MGFQYWDRPLAGARFYRHLPIRVSAMLKKSDCSLSIPGELIEALANEIAARVSAQLKETLATLNAQHRNDAPFGKAAQADLFEAL